MSSLLMDTTTPDVYTLSLHDALPIFSLPESEYRSLPSYPGRLWIHRRQLNLPSSFRRRSEEHTSELQSRGHLVCRLPLEKKNKVRTIEERVKLEHMPKSEIELMHNEL